MKWLLFLLSVFAMWVAFNSLFMLPGHYSSFNFELAGFCISVGVLLAWVSGKRFVDAGPKRRRRAAVMEAPPMVLCTFILLVFIAIGIVKFMAYR